MATGIIGSMSSGKTSTTRQWSSTAGPRQTKLVTQAAGKLRWHVTDVKQITDHGENVVNSPFGKKNPAVLEAIARIEDQYGLKITKENFKDIVASFEAALKSIPPLVEDTRTTADERKQLEEERTKNRIEQEDKSRLAAAETNRIVAELREKYPWAKSESATAANGKQMTRVARAAANMREELRRAFPGVTFSVTSENFSMGNAIRVKWENGPTGKEVEEITGKYTEGSFNGMIDMYEGDRSSHGRAVEIVLGRAKYVSEYRDISPGLIEIVGRALCEAQKVPYVNDMTPFVFGNGDPQYLRDHVNKMFAECSIPVGAKVLGVEHNTDHVLREPYVIKLSEVAKPDPVLATSVKSVARGTVQKHTHTKKGFDFWLVVLNDRIERDEFDKIRDLCKTAGGWYSRQWGKTPGGFAFDTESAAVAFCNSL